MQFPPRQVMEKFITLHARMFNPYAFPQYFRRTAPMVGALQVWEFLGFRQVFYVLSSTQLEDLFVTVMAANSQLWQSNLQRPFSLRTVDSVSEPELFVTGQSNFITAFIAAEPGRWAVIDALITLWVVTSPTSNPKHYGAVEL